MSSYENILNRMLDNISVDIDKREGSFVRDMVSPIATELAKAYIEQQDLVNMAFVKNGFFNYLDDKCAEYGITRKQETNATGEVVFEGTNGTVVSNGTILFYNDLYFVVLNDADITGGQATLIVESLEAGSKYNLEKNTELTMQDKIDGINRVYVKSGLANGSNAETDEELRDRFFETIKKSYTSGNVAHYETWTLEVDGTGACKVYPLKNGNGTVEIVITNSEMLGASSELIEKVKANIEEKRPIGANVTVVSATEKKINVSATITLANGYSLEDVKSAYSDMLINYLKDISFKTSYVSVARLGNLLLDTDGVFDYTEFKVNGNTNNVALTDIEIPKIGTITFTVV